MDIIQIIKKAAVDAVAASKPTAIIEGTVTSVSPIKIQLNQLQTLDKDFVTLLDPLKSSLKKGDKVVILRADGGQRHYVIGRL